MKKNILFFLAVVLVGTTVWSDEYHPPFTCGAQPCDQTPMRIPERVENEYFYASVEARSHMDLEFVLHVKEGGHRFNVKVIGGDGARFDVKNNQDVEAACKLRNDVTDLNWLSSQIATHQVGGQSSSFSATYIVCLYDRGTNGPYSRLLRAAIVSNSEVGD